MARRVGMMVILLAGSLIAARARGDVQCAPDRPWDCRNIAIQAQVDLTKREFQAVATLDLLATREASSVVLDAVNLDVASVSVQRGPGPAFPAFFHLADHALEVPIDAPAVRLGEQVQIVIAYTVHDPKEGLHFFAPCEGDPDIPLEMWSQGECCDTRRWIPCFDDPGDLQTTRMTVTVAAGNEAVSNGRLVSRKDNPDGTTTFDWLQDKPHASYLITLAVGKFAVVQETWHGKPLMYYVPPAKKDQVQNAFGRTQKMLDLFSRLTGVEYPWDKYAQVCAEQFNGGMENTSATTLTTEMLHDDRAHIDSDTDDYISHELAHQWFGDLVTCRTWAHAWLNEGFATFFEAMWQREAGGREAYEGYIFNMGEEARAGAADTAVMERDYSNPDHRFDARIYQKPGFVLNMLMHKMGEETFWRAVNKYLTRYRHQPVETTDFRRVCEAEYGGSLERFFYDWIERPEYPVVHVTYAWSAESRSAALSLKQKGKSEPFHFPLEAAFRLSTGEVIRRSWDVDTREATFTAALSNEPVMVSVDPDCMVFADWNVDLPAAMWIEQLRHDPSVAGRIRAARELGKDKSDAAVSALAEALGAGPFWRIGAEIAERLAKADTPTARAALLKGLESKDPRVRAACAGHLGKVKTEPDIVAGLRKLVTNGDPSYRVEAAAINAWSDHHPDDAMTVLPTLLARGSEDEMIRRAALKGLAEQKRPDALDLILEWAKRGKPGVCRRSAVQSAGRYVQKADPDEEVRRRIAGELSGYLEGESDRMIAATASVLGDVGKPAAAALPKLKAVSAGTLTDHVRRIVDRAITQIQGTEEENRRDHTHRRRAAAHHQTHGDKTGPSIGDDQENNNDVDEGGPGPADEEPRSDATRVRDGESAQVDEPAIDGRRITQTQARSAA